MPGFFDCGAKVLLEGKTIVAPFGTNFPNQLDFFVGNVLVSKHHQRKELEGGLVFQVGSGVYCDAAVQLDEAIIHTEATLDDRPLKNAAGEILLMINPFNEAQPYPVMSTDSETASVSYFTEICKRCISRINDTGQNQCVLLR